MWTVCQDGAFELKKKGFLQMKKPFKDRLFFNRPQQVMEAFG
jgi:hypothetical protein